jgi:spore coat protein U-like protein
MKMLRSLGYAVLMLLLAAGLATLPTPLRASTANITCTSTTTAVTFPSFDPSGTGAATTAGGIQFRCTNSSLLGQDVTLCIGLGQGSGSSISPLRQMTGSLGNNLNFQVYTGASTATPIWGNVPSTANPAPVKTQFFVAIGGTFTSTTYTVFGSIPTPQPGVPTDTYMNSLNGSIAYNANDAPLGIGTYPANCDAGGTAPFTLSVQATVAHQCSVTAGAILNLGSVASTATNLSGSNTLNVTCTIGTPYYVGLAPSNGSTTGNGSMKGTGANTDTIAYQLRSTSGISGLIWGNTATSTTTGNGVQGAGTGTSQTLTVYATVASANVTPDTYTDIVTVNVNY